MNRLDDELLNEFSDVTTRIKTEFDAIESSRPAHRKRINKKPLALVAVAGAIAASIVVVPSLSGNSNVNQPAWAATPTVLSESQLQEIKSVCTENGAISGYKIAVADERVETGFMLLYADRGPKFNTTRYSTLLCEYVSTDTGYEPTMKFEANEPNFTSFFAWGGPEEVGGIRAWTFQSAATSEVARVEITTAQELVFNASIGNGFTFAWWPFVEETNSAGDAAKTGCTDAYVRYYDAEGNLLKTFSMLNGETTEP